MHRRPLQIGDDVKVTWSNTVITYGRIISNMCSRIVIQWQDTKDEDIFHLIDERWTLQGEWPTVTIELIQK